MRHAVILAGGGGTRLWPASRRKRPKQFLSIGSRTDESLIAATVRRLHPLIEREQVWVVTAAEHAQAIVDGLRELPPQHVIAEPVARNTAAAIGLAAAHLLHADPNAVMAILPSDHSVLDEERFRVVADHAFRLVEKSDVIVTVGIEPTRPDTGFGYLEVDNAGTDVLDVLRFVEKPDAARAQAFMDSGRHLWNGGIFFLSARRTLAEIERHLPQLHAGLRRIATALPRGSEETARVTAEVYPGLPSISVDHGIMEKAQGLVALRGTFGWSDVGTWAALAELRPPDSAGNFHEGPVFLKDASGNIVVTDDGTAIALVGVSNLIVVKSRNAILVVPRDRAQDVRDIVRDLTDRELDEYL